jgi:hypothetical protein
MNEATAAFIREHADDDIRQLALRGTKDPEVDLNFALEQIAGQQTARRKLPTWAATDAIVYPPHLSMEQCSSEQTARYKAALALTFHPAPSVTHAAPSSQPQASPSTLVDLTGGFGVDFSFLARDFSRAVYVERQPHLCEIARHNFRLLGLEHAEVVCGDGVDYLRQMEPVDLIYIDPARRDDHGGRTYGIDDCTPDVLAIRNLLLQKARRVMLKLSPMLDWQKAVRDLGEVYVREVHIVAVGNECKELLLMLAAGSGFRLVCVNDDSVFEPHPTSSAPSPLCSNPVPAPASFLYEPNASIMKAGCFEAVAHQYGVCQIAANSHLFLSPRRVESFPGRQFVIERVTSLNKRALKESIGHLSQANITVRNFPMSVAELRRRLKLSEGGSTYIFATTLATGEKVLLVCSPLR